VETNHQVETKTKKKGEDESAGLKAAKPNGMSPLTSPFLTACASEGCLPLFF